MLLAAGLGFFVAGKPIFALLGPLFLLPVAAQYFLAPGYRLDGEKARAAWGFSISEILWPDVRKVTLSDEGVVHLSPLEGNDVRQRFRGVVLQLPRVENQRIRAVEFLRLQCSPHARIEGIPEAGVGGSADAAG